MRRPRAILVALLSLLVFAALPAQATRSLPSLRDSLGTQAPLGRSLRPEADVSAAERCFRLFDEADLSFPPRVLELEELRYERSCSYDFLTFDYDEGAHFVAESRHFDLRLAGPRLGASRTFPGTRPSLFQGAWTDPITGIAYHRNRWYDPRTASWLSEDPAGAVDSPNLYAFVGWGPQVGSDPLGEAVYGIEGTGQDTVGTKNPSNVAKICAAANQVQPGSGICSEGPGAHFPMKILGGVTGAGLEAIVEKMYWEVVERYNAGDKEIAIIGFSRGAAGARHLANLIYERGIPDLGTGKAVSKTIETRTDIFVVDETVYSQYFHPDVQFLGLFDTVASTGDPTDDDEWVNLSIPPNVQVVRQAFALDEGRSQSFSLESVLDPDNPNDPRIQEKGFPGDHSDIGGGHDDGPRGDGGWLRDFSLLWVADEAIKAGVKIAPIVTPSRTIDEVIYHDMTTNWMYKRERKRNEKFFRKYGVPYPRQINYHNNP